MKKVDIIIPFYGDQTQLKKCLASIESAVNEVRESALCEIIVVDNHERPKVFAKDFPSLVIAHESTPGSYAARNKGLKSGSGDILFFTDADTVVARDWIANGLRELERKSDCALFGGRIILTYNKEDSPSLLELYERIFYFQQKDYVEKEGYAATANLFGKREVFESLKGFDPSLRSGGDQDFCHRAYELGFQVSYDPEVIVYHPSRSNIKDFLTRRVRSLSGHFLLSYRKEGLSPKAIKDKLHFFREKNSFSSWNGDWDYFEGLSDQEKVRIKKLHSFLIRFDRFILWVCLRHYGLMKRLTLIDRGLF